jgi:hypothetical protein
MPQVALQMSMPAATTSDSNYKIPEYGQSAARREHVWSLLTNEASVPKVVIVAQLADARPPTTGHIRQLSVTVTVYQVLLGGQAPAFRTG